MKNISNKIFRSAVLMALFLVGISAFAQSRITVKGTVKDSKGEPVIGAVVMPEGSTTNGAVTDVNGAYTLSFTPQAGKKTNLVVSCIGYATLTEDLAKRSVVNFVLQDDAELLDEVVVVGYGSMRRSDLTGSVTSVKIDENEAGQSTSFDQMLQGRAAGVNVVSNSASPDAGVSITIRGMNSFSGSSEPLYVVDGIILNTSSSTASFSNSGQDNSGSSEGTNGLMGINTNDIASMEILKDASATAIYGSQGANGVVLITTKTASKERPVIRFNVGVDISTRYKKKPMLDAYEYENYYREYSEVWGKGLTPSTGSIIYTDLESMELKVDPIDWQDYTMRTAVSQRYYLSISGRPKQTSYMFSMAYNKSQGIVKTTGFDNYTIRLNLDRNITKKFKIGIRSGLSYVNSNLTQGASTGRLTQATSMMRSMTYTRPWRGLGNMDEEEDPFDEGDDLGTYRSGPDKWLTDFQSKREEIRITPSIYAEWKVLKWLTFKSTFGGDYRSTDVLKCKTIRINTTVDGTSAGVSHIDRLNYNWDNLLMFNQKWGAHSLSGTLGMSTSKDKTTTQTVEGNNIVQYKAMTAAINSAPNAFHTYGISDSSQMSFFARAIYNYKDRYVLTATYRFDGSSKFKGANKWAQFPSFALAWRLNQEPWFNVPVISMAKVRVGWGRVGNQAISSYQTMANYSNAYYPDHNPDNAAQKNVNVYPSNLSNPSLKWETTEQTNIGIDLGLWKGRFTFTADAYYKVTKDLLQSKKISGSSGFGSMYVNLGSVENKGLEFTVDATPVKTRDFEWSIGGNIAFNRGKILQIGTAAEADYVYLSEGNRVFRSFFYGDNIGSGSYVNAPLNIFIEGEPMALFYGLKTDGIVQEGQSCINFDGVEQERRPGSLKYVDVNGDGVISTTNDRCIIGDPNPDFTYGFNTSFNYKRFTLSLTFVGSYGNDIFNVNNVLDSYTTNSNGNITHNAYYGAWKPSNPSAKYYGMYTYTSNDMYAASDFFVEDGSYLRLSTVSLNYNVPIKNKKAFLKGLNLGVTASNPIIFTHYTGWDPDVNSYGSLMRKGADMGSYPGARTFRFDVKFTF